MGQGGNYSLYAMEGQKGCFIPEFNVSRKQVRFCSQQSHIQSQWTVQKIKLVTDYNAYMGGVDKSDQLINTIELIRQLADLDIHADAPLV